jgi:hypothetical protein
MPSIEVRGARFFSSSDMVIKVDSRVLNVDGRLLGLNGRLLFSVR